METRPSDTLKREFGQWLKQQREESHLSQGGAATRAGFGSQTETETGLFSGLEKLSPERQQIAKQTIRALIDSLAAQENHKTENE